MVDFAHGFTELGMLRVGPVPVPVFVTAVLYLLGVLLLNFTRFGRHVLAIGGNEEGARLAGIPVERTLVAVYSMSGALAGLAGVFLAALSFSGSPTGAIGWELSAIAAVVVGGTLLTGGVGSSGEHPGRCALAGIDLCYVEFRAWPGHVSAQFLLGELHSRCFLVDRGRVPEPVGAEDRGSGIGPHPEVLSRQPRMTRASASRLPHLSPAPIAVGES